MYTYFKEFYFHCVETSSYWINLAVAWPWERASLRVFKSSLKVPSLCVHGFPPNDLTALCIHITMFTECIATLWPMTPAPRVIAMYESSRHHTFMMTHFWWCYVRLIPLFDPCVYNVMYICWDWFDLEAQLENKVSVVMMLICLNATQSLFC